MKLPLVIVIAAIALTKAQADSNPGRQVRVYLTEDAAVPLPLRARAQILATRMFADIGVSLQWRRGNSPALDTDAIAIKLTGRTPESLRPGALAFALPFERVHIRIFWDRIALSPVAPQLLAHVMVHEIAHILQNVDEHSKEGIMKAQWTKDDQLTMRVAPLQFTPADVERIYSGMENRGVRSLLAAAPASTRSHD